MKNTYKTFGMNIISSNTDNQNLISLMSLVIFKLKNLFADLVNYLTSLVLKPRRIVIVGVGQKGIGMYNLINAKRAIGYKFMGFFDNNANGAYPVKGDLNALKEYCINEKINEIYFTLPDVKNEVIADFARFAEANFIFLHIDNKKAESLAMDYFDAIPAMSINRHPLASRLNQMLKRAFDIVFSLCVLAILVPFVFPIIALLIKLESRGPVFFVQKRPGLHNKLFGCYKFRSMTVNNNGDVQATKNDARITKVGAFLRKTSLDELPQFINVLMGNMSVVGPRPNMQKQLEFYSQHISNYSARHFVKPGITGHAQVNGFRGETNTIDLMEKRVEHDLKYIQNWNLAWDAKIVFLTAYNIVRGEENAY